MNFQLRIITAALISVVGSLAGTLVNTAQAQVVGPKGPISGGVSYLSNPSTGREGNFDNNIYGAVQVLGSVASSMGYGGNSQEQLNQAGRELQMAHLGSTNLSSIFPQQKLALTVNSSTDVTRPFEVKYGSATTALAWNDTPRNGLTSWTNAETTLNFDTALTPNAAKMATAMATFRTKTTDIVVTAMNEGAYGINNLNNYIDGGNGAVNGSFGTLRTVNAAADTGYAPPTTNLIKIEAARQVALSGTATQEKNAQAVSLLNDYMGLAKTISSIGSSIGVSSMRINEELAQISSYQATLETAGRTGEWTGIGASLSNNKVGWSSSILTAEERLAGYGSYWVLPATDLTANKFTVTIKDVATPVRWSASPEF